MPVRSLHTKVQTDLFLGRVSGRSGVGSFEPRSSAWKGREALDLRRCASMLVVWTLVCGAIVSTSATAAVNVGDTETRATDEAMGAKPRSVTSSVRRVPRTTRMRLHGGRVITVWRVCVWAKGISGKKRAMEVEADRLAPLRQTAERREAAVKAFLRAHPERALPSGLYARFEALRDAYSLAVSKYNAQVSRYNAAVKRHNDVLYACKV